MAVIGNYGTGSVYSIEYSTVDELLAQIPDNTAHLIDASDVRDSVYTLWNRVSTIFASFSASFSVLYTNTTPTPIAVGGIPAGSTFSNNTMQEMWDMLLYPYVAPSCTLSAANTPREMGSSNAVVLSWTSTKGSEITTSITVETTSITVTSGNQSGTKATTSTQNATTTFSMLVSDGSSNISATTAVYWQDGVYWGKTPTFALPSMLVPVTKPTWADGAGVGSGKKLASSLAGTYNLIDGSGQYLVFAWPSSFVGSGTNGDPKFTVNGFVATSFAKLGSAIPFTNMHGYTTTYDVWVSYTAQNAQLSTFVIS
jgi:hypothetical protein